MSGKQPDSPRLICREELDGLELSRHEGKSSMCFQGVRDEGDVSQNKSESKGSHSVFIGFQFFCPELGPSVWGGMTDFLNTFVVKGHRKVTSLNEESCHRLCCTLVNGDRVRLYGVAQTRKKT